MIRRALLSAPRRIARVPNPTTIRILTPATVRNMSSAIYEAPSAAEEDAQFDKAVKDLETKWKEGPRWRGITRPYSAADVVAKRGSLEQTYASSHQARKLWELLQARGKEGKPVHTSQ